MRPLTPAVKNIIIINLLMFGGNILLNLIFNIDLINYFSLHYIGSPDFKLHQFFTYMFVQVDMITMLFTSLSLYFFGTMLEDLWGSKKFLNFYIWSGVLIGISISIVYIAVTWKMTGKIIINNEMSGFNIFHQTQYGPRWVLFSVWTAMALIYPNFEVFLYFVIPIKVKYMWLLFVLIEILSIFTSADQDFYNLYFILITSIISYLMVRFYLGYRLN